MKKKKFIFVLTVCIAVALGFWLYVHEHGTVSTTAAAPGISAGQAILIDGDTGKILYEKNADEKAYPASTTKIMTALITLDVLEQYDSPIEQKITVPESAQGVEGSSMYLKAGEKISIEDLLYGLMLVSGNDAAVALAEIIGGSQENFVAMMNDKASELGCRDTHFVNPHGLFDEDHYTTARDMAIIACEAMKNETLRKIAAAKTWRAERQESDYLTFANKNKTVHEFAGGNGIKIGYTEASGRTLVASARRNGRTMICVVMSAPNWFQDAYQLMEYGFDL